MKGRGKERRVGEENELSELRLIVLQIGEELAHFVQMFTAWRGARGVVVVLGRFR